MIGIQIETLLALRKAYEKLRLRYMADSRTEQFNGYEVLILILMASEKSASPKEFSELLSCKPAQVTGYVSRLENLGLVRRKISPDDRRSFEFKLTTNGKKKCCEFQDITQDIYFKNTKLSSDENKKLVDLLHKL